MNILHLLFFSGNLSLICTLYIRHIPNDTFIPWINPNMERTDLLCPNATCIQSNINVFQSKTFKVGELFCCSCLSKTKWEIFGIEKFTNLEYVNDGSAVILTDVTDTAPHVFCQSQNWIFNKTSFEYMQSPQNCEIRL